jgi:hypothetical protein
MVNKVIHYDPVFRGKRQPRLQLFFNLCFFLFTYVFLISKTTTVELTQHQGDLMSL